MHARSPAAPKSPRRPAKSTSARCAMSDKPGRFTLLSRLLHWSMAAMVIAQLLLGVTMVASLSYYPLLLAIHRPLGIAILVFAVVRLVNRLTHHPPPGLARREPGRITRRWRLGHPPPKRAKNHWRDGERCGGSAPSRGGVARRVVGGSGGVGATAAGFVTGSDATGSGLMPRRAPP